MEGVQIPGVALVECLGGSAPGRTHSACRHARTQASVALLVHPDRARRTAVVTVELKTGALSPASLARAADLVGSLYPLAGWGKQGIVTATLIEVTGVPKSVVSDVVQDLVALFMAGPR